MIPVQLLASPVILDLYLKIVLPHPVAVGIVCPFFNDALTSLFQHAQIILAPSFNGRTPDSESGNVGSNPAGAANSPVV